MHTLLLRLAETTCLLGKWLLAVEAEWWLISCWIGTCWCWDTNCCWGIKEGAAKLAKFATDGFSIKLITPCFKVAAAPPSDALGKLKVDEGSCSIEATELFREGISRVFSGIRSETTDDDVVGITFEIEDSACSFSDTADESAHC